MRAKRDVWSYKYIIRKWAQKSCELYQWKRKSRIFFNGRKSRNIIWNGLQMHIRQEAALVKHIDGYMWKELWKGGKQENKKCREEWGNHSKKKKIVRNDIMDSGVIGVWQQIGLSGEVELTKPTPNKWDKDDDDLDGHLKCSSWSSVIEHPSNSHIITLPCKSLMKPKRGCINLPSTKGKPISSLQWIKSENISIVALSLQTPLFSIKSPIIDSSLPIITRSFPLILTTC